MGVKQRNLGLFGIAIALSACAEPFRCEDTLTCPPPDGVNEAGTGGAPDPGRDSGLLSSGDELGDTQLESGTSDGTSSDGGGTAPGDPDESGIEDAGATSLTELDPSFDSGGVSDDQDTVSDESVTDDAPDAGDAPTGVDAGTPDAGEPSAVIEAAQPDCALGSSSECSCSPGYALEENGCVPTLLALDLVNADLEPAFEPQQLVYGAQTSLFNETLILSAQAADGVEIRVNGQSLGSGATWTSPTLSLGRTALRIELFEGGMAVRAYDIDLTRGSPTAYLKASNVEYADEFGSQVALSADGSTLAVSAPSEESAATGIGGDQSNNDAPYAGAVYVFKFVDGAWLQEAYVKASNTSEIAWFGRDLSLSSNGDVLAVGAPGDDTDESPGFGSAYVFRRSEGFWTQEGHITVSSLDSSDTFGSSIALASHAEVLAVGAKDAVYVFQNFDGVWNEQAQITASSAEEGDGFGGDVALSSDGSTLAVGAIQDDSDSRGIGGDALNNDASASGAAYVFQRNNGTWAQEAYIKASNADPGDYFGSAVSLSGEGDVLAVGAWVEDGTGADPDDNAAPVSGAAYVFVRTNGAWTEQAYLKVSNVEAGDEFGESVALSGDGQTLAVGARREDSGSVGINGAQDDESASDSGAVYVFKRTAGDWEQRYYLKATNTGAGDLFGGSVALSADGATLAVGASREASSDGNPNDNQAEYSGAVYVYR